MDREMDRLPDGTTFPFWDDETDYERTYHVDREHPAADDDNPGTEDEPLGTIGRAAELVEPGEKVVVHEGVYREPVRPARGGGGPDRMIAYEAAPGDDVVVRGSRVVTEGIEPTEGWNVGNLPNGETVWTAPLPDEWFVGYNPFATRNLPSADRYYLEPAAAGRLSEAEHKRLMARRGLVFVDGEALEQVFYPHELGDAPGTFWVEDPGLRIHFRLPDGVDESADAAIEATTEEQLFAPDEPGLGYVRVSGFTFERAADGVPIPQRAMVSANLGHHWIVEDNRIRWANACGIDVGDSTWHRRDADARRADSGHHVIRGNHVSHCGACGIAAMHNNRYTLVEDNVVEDVGDRNVERIWETAGLKFHVTDGVLIRSNVFRRIRHASGLWLDYLNENTRVTGNVIADVRSLKGGIYNEVSHDAVLVDHNVIWNVRGDDPTDDSGDDGGDGGNGGNGDVGSRGHGIDVDTGEGCTVAHNLIGRIPDGFGVSLNLNQSSRVVDGRVGLCRDHAVLNNVFVSCPRRVEFGRTENNRADGNLYDADDDPTSFLIASPEPERVLNFEGWRRFFGFDERGAQAAIDAAFDPETDALEVTVDGEVPAAVPVDDLTDASPTPGPFELESGRTERTV